MLGGGKVPLSESTKAVWARQGRAKRQRKQHMKNGLLFSLPVLVFLRFLVTSALQPGLPPRADFVSPGFNKSEGGDKGKDIAEDIFSLKCELERVNGGSVLAHCSGC